MNANATNDWQAALAEGDSSRALQLYLSVDVRDDATTAFLRICCDLREDLRAKRWRKAQRRLEDIAPQGAPLATGRLAQQIAALEDCSRLLDQRKPEEALALLDDVDQPLLRAEAETQKGTALIFMNQTEAAAEAFARAVASDARHYRALTNRGNLALEAGRLQDAIADYEAALSINAEFSNAHHNLGVAYRRQGKIAKSVRSIRKAQRSLRQEDREEAREAMKSLGKRVDLPWLKYILYAAVAVGLYFLLSSMGVI